MEYHHSYNLVFISTFINRNNIDKLIGTVLESNHDLSIFFIIVNQTKTKLVLHSSPLIDFYQINTERLSLSKARNVGINYLLKNSIHFKHIMFPDDDTSFSDIFFSKYKEYIKDEENYLIDVYCFGTDKLFKPNNFKNGDVLLRENHSSVMSVNMIINYRTFYLVGLFDERMGAGAKYGSGEDGDYYIRACDISMHGFIYNKMIFNFHPSSENKFLKMSLYQTIKTYVNYGNGAIFVLCKHKMYFVAFKICFLAIGGALISFCKLDMKLFVAYSTAFFSRLIMFLKCLICFKRYKYDEMVS